VTRAVYLTLAAVFFVLAAAGTVLPVLPTTPFLLLTSFCLARSSPGLNARLRRSPWFGPLLVDWETRRGVRPHVKATALTSMAAVVAYGLAGGVERPALRLVLVGLAVCGAVVVLRLKTLRD
jgi:uncharacterized membrane protein YbaN (DUF454 family)